MDPEDPTPPFRIDRVYDREMASDGLSRYGSYVRDALARDIHAWDLGDNREFASLAWRAGTGPVMAPGYIRYHPLISGASVHRSSWDGTLVGSVAVMSPPPQGLGRLLRWNGWPTDLQGGVHVPVGPYDRDVVRRSDYRTGFALTTVELLFPLHDLDLPELPAEPDAPDVVEAASAAAAVLVAALNDIVQPVLDSL